MGAAGLAIIPSRGIGTLLSFLIGTRGRQRAEWVDLFCVWELPLGWADPRSAWEGKVWTSTYVLTLGKASESWFWFPSAHVSLRIIKSHRTLQQEAVRGRRVIFLFSPFKIPVLLMACEAYEECRWARNKSSHLWLVIICQPDHLLVPFWCFFLAILSFSLSKTSPGWQSSGYHSKFSRSHATSVCVCVCGVWAHIHASLCVRKNRRRSGGIY